MPVMKHLLIQSRHLVFTQNFSKQLCTSALFVTGDKASEMYAVLTPHIDFATCFNNMDKLQRNVQLRGLTVNVDKLKDLCDLMRGMQEDKLQLEKRRVEIANRMNSLKNNKTVVKSDVEKFRIEGKMVRDDLKNLMKGLWDLEGNTMLKVLALPNILHSDTPDCEARLIHEFKSIPDTKQTESHLQVGKRANLLHYINTTNYYLLGDAALLEFETLNYFGEKLRNHNSIRFSNTDFSRSIVIEGVGMKHKSPVESFLLKSEEDEVNDDDRLHLVGGASLASFCAFHTKQIIHPESLPAKYYSVGRQYIPKTRSPSLGGLFDVWQSSAVEMFIVTSNSFDHMMQEFNTALTLLISSYEKLKYPFRVVYLPANALHTWESLRASVQMYSMHNEAYVEVGHLSLCDDFISKRLLMTYQDDDKSEQQFVNIISGTALSIPRFLACVLEQSSDDDLPLAELLRLLHNKNN